MSQVHPLSAESRARPGRGAARAVRRSASVPGILYGGGEAPRPISLQDAELKKALSRGKFLSTLFDLALDGGTVRVIPRGIQFHPVTDRPVHVDFMRLQAGAKITVAVPVSFVNQGISPGIKLGGVLNIVRHEVELICPVDLIPNQIEIDLAAARIGDSIHISAVKLPEGVSPRIRDRDFTVATIVPPAKEERVVEAAAAPAAEAKDGAKDAAPAKDGGKDGAAKDAKK